MKIILECSSSDENYNGGCDYALVDLTPELARNLLSKHHAFMRLHKQTKAYEAYWWDCSATFFSPYPMFEEEPKPEETARVELELQPMQDGYLEVPDDFRLGENMEARTDCDQMCVREDGVWWFCHPKNDGAHITTPTVPKRILERAAGPRKGKQR